MNWSWLCYGLTQIIFKGIVIQRVIKKHPTLVKKINRFFLITWFLAFFLFIISGYGNNLFPNYDPKKYIQVTIKLLFILYIIFFATVWYLLKFVKCPECGDKTITKSSTKELPKSHSAYCQKCNILWNLGVGNSE